MRSRNRRDMAREGKRVKNLLSIFSLREGRGGGGGRTRCSGREGRKGEAERDTQPYSLVQSQLAYFSGFMCLGGCITHPEDLVLCDFFNDLD